MAADDAKRPATALRIKVRYADLDTFVDRFAVNIARSGIFIPTRQPKPVGDEVRFEIRLANDQAVLVGQGVVRWIREADPEKPKAVVGMGVALQRVSKESRDVLLRMLEVRKQRGLPDPPGGLPQPPDDDEAKERDEGTTQVRAMAAVATAPAPASDDEGKTQIRQIPRRPQTPTGRPGRETTPPPPSGGVTNDSPTRVGPMPVSNDSPTRIAPVPVRPVHVIPRSERSGPVAVPPPEPISPPVNPFAAAAAAASAAEIRLPAEAGGPAPTDAPTNPFAAAAAAAAAVIATQEPEEPIDVPAAPRPPSAPPPPVARSSRQRPVPSDLAAAASASLSAASHIADELDQEIDVSAVVVRARSLATGDLDNELESLSGGVVVEEISAEEVSGRLARELGTSAPSLRKRPRATPDALPTPSRPRPVPDPVLAEEPIPNAIPSRDADADPDASSDSAAIAAAAASAAAVADSASDAAAAADAAAEAAAAEASAAAAAAIAATTPPRTPVPGDGAHRGAGAASRGRRQLTAPPPPRPKSATSELRANEDRLARERAERERVERDRVRAERERAERERLRVERETQDRDRIRREHEERDRIRAEREIAERDRLRAEHEANERARDKQRRELAERDARRRAAFAPAPVPLPGVPPALDLEDGASVVAAEAMGARELKAALTPAPEVLRSVPHVQAQPPVHARPGSRTQPPPPPPPRPATRTAPPPPATPALEEALAGLDQAAETDTTGVAHKKTPPPARAQSVEIEIDDDFEIEIDIDMDD